MPYEGVGRRRELAAAALGRSLEPPKVNAEDGVTYGAVEAEILDISPHVLIAESVDGEQLRLVIAPWATAWRGVAVSPGDLPIGARVIIKTLRSGAVIDRIWADITRITGIIRSVSGFRDITVELDCGPHLRPRTIVIPYRSSGRVRVRHPQLEPGFLFDAIGLVDQGATLAYLPATSQPPYRADDVPRPDYGATQSKVSGTAVWSDMPDYGVAYPMLERADTDCDDAEVSCSRLPYLSLGSMLYVRNVCSGRANLLPIVACGCVAGRFCDRCVECGTSPRGRVAELSAAAYVELGGELTKGCFNTRIGLG
ncbi:hypothetical protein J5X84_07735 [Streptosporangiaceae bacterium NEAU-GS5]|nr:hypothetical protein [Streptosporangiaceae bacterium NEAU-GS5]